MVFIRRFMHKYVNLMRDRQKSQDRGRGNEFGNEYVDGDIVSNAYNADGDDINRDRGESSLRYGPNHSLRDIYAITYGGNNLDGDHITHSLDIDFQKDYDGNGAPSCFGRRPMAPTLDALWSLFKPYATFFKRVVLLSTMGIP